MFKSKVNFSVTKNGKKLSKKFYTWDKKTRTFSTLEDGLVLDFNDMNNCTFNTGSDCTFNTGSECTFTTGNDCTFNTTWGCMFTTGSECTFTTGNDCTFNTTWGCTFNTTWGCTFRTGTSCIFDVGDNCTFKTGFRGTFKTGSECTFTTGNDCTFRTGNNCTFNTTWRCTFRTGNNCIFNTGSGCTFNTGSECTFKTGSECVLIRRDVFEFYNISNKQIQICPFGIKGYIENGYYYVNGEKQYKAIIVDGILSEVLNHKGNVYKVRNYIEHNISYIIKDGDVYSHGKTIREARENLIYKISNRDTSM